VIAVAIIQCSLFQSSPRAEVLTWQPGNASGDGSRRHWLAGH